jgi:hypothetical protein
MAYADMDRQTLLEEEMKGPEKKEEPGEEKPDEEKVD